MQDEFAALIITLPICRDGALLENAVETLEQATKEISKHFILVIAEDGSNSSMTVNSLRKKYSNILYFQNDQRLGRGKALREAWKKVRGDIYVYVDVDLATDLLKLDAYKKLIELQEEADLVTGSRYVKGSETNRPKLRKYFSLAYNVTVRILFKTGIHDHQCGFKSFSRRTVDFLATEARSDTWFWDTEALVLAKKYGFRVVEIPVSWIEKRGKRTPVKRLIKDIMIHGVGLLRLLWITHF